MTCTLTGHIAYNGSRDSEGHREYRVTFEVLHDTTDGPANILQTSGLPTFGAPFSIVGLNDNDPWAYCRWDASVTPVITKEPNTVSNVEVLFSTKPVLPGQGRMCRDFQFEDPLTEPQKISGSFVKYQEEATFDRFNLPVVNSAWEQLRGPQVEFDKSKMQVRIEQNVPDLQLPLVASMIDTVNGFYLWGLNPRMIKLSQCTWERKYYGACYIYFTRTFEFDIDFRTFDRDILDEGTKVINGHWDATTGNYVRDPIAGYSSTPGQNPDPFNPAHFIRFKDRQGENSKVILDGQGNPASVVVGTDIGTYYISIQPNTGPGGLDNPNLNQPLTNRAWWLPVLSRSFPGPAGWDENQEYEPGDVVTWVGHYFVALTPNFDSQPVPGVIDQNWQDVGTTVTSKGTWNKTTTYSQGDYVLDPSVASGIGRRHIEKYDESDFTLLNIPIDLTSNF